MATESFGYRGVLNKETICNDDRKELEDASDRRVDAVYQPLESIGAGGQKLWSASLIAERELQRRDAENAERMRAAFPGAVIEPDGRVRLLGDERLTKRQQIAATCLSSLIPLQYNTTITSDIVSEAIALADELSRQTAEDQQ